MLGRSLCTLVFVLVASTGLGAGPSATGEWSRFRGPNGSGISTSADLPREFGPGKNEVWAAEIPFGRSSPAIAGDRIFLTAVDDGKLVTIALDRASGKTVWRREIEREREAEFHEATDSSTPTPVTDGTNVYVLFHEAGLVSYDASGKQRWRVDLGPFRNFYGIASSPVLAGKTLLVLCDQAEGSFLLALDKDSGRERWRHKRARLESYTTPILLPDDKRPRTVIVSGSRWVDAYDVASGKVVWSVGGVGSGPIASPVLDGNRLFISTVDHAAEGWPPFEGLLAQHDKDGDGELSREDVQGVWIANHFGWLNADGKGNITAADWEHLGKEVVNENWGVYAIRLGSRKTKPEIVWNYRQNVAYIPSPLVHDGVFFMVKDGILTSLDAGTGELGKRGRLRDGSPKVYASPVAGDGKLYVATLDGTVAVVTAERQWKVLATNSLGDEIWASPAIADGHLYVRTKSKLYSFAAAGPTDTGASAR